MSTHIIPLYRNTEVEDYLDAAKKVADFIRKNEKVDANGKHWNVGTVEGKEADLVESTFVNERTIYAGAAGIGYFFVQLFEVTGDESYLNDALAAGDYLISTYSEEVSRHPGVHAGASGEGVFLELLYEKTKNEKYRQHSIRIADDVYRSATHDESGIHWDGFFDLMGDAGVVLFWLEIAQKTGEVKYLKYSKEVLDSILKLGVVYDEETTYWKLFDPAVYFGSLPKGGVVPNFAHGTAGVVYLLTKYYESTGEELYLEEAKKGLNFLKKIAIREDDSAIVPYLYFEKDKKPYDVYYLGYCHGPAGDGVAVYELYKVTKDESYLEFYRELTNALIKAGVPDKRSSGYWNDCLCCGSAGILEHFISVSAIDDKYLSYARRTADKTIADAYKDEDGYRWYNAWTRIKPWDVDAHLGLFIGAAGSASALLSLYAKLKDIKITELPEFER